MEKKMQQKIDAFNTAYAEYDASDYALKDGKKRAAAEAAKALVEAVLQNGGKLDQETEWKFSNNDYELLLKLTRVNFDEALKITNELDLTQLKKFYSQSLKIGENEIPYFFIRTAVQNERWDVIKDIFSQRLLEVEEAEGVISMLYNENRRCSLDQEGLKSYKDMLEALAELLNTYGASIWMRSVAFGIISSARFNNENRAGSPELLKAELKFYSDTLSLLEREERCKVLFERDVMRCSLFYNLTELSQKLGDFSELKKITSFLTKEEKEKLAIETNGTGYNQVYKIVDRFVKDQHNKWTTEDKVKYYATWAACTALSWYFTRSQFLPPVINIAAAVGYGKVVTDAIYALSKPDAKKFGLGGFASTEVGGGVSI